MPPHVIFSDFVDKVNFPRLHMICEQLHLSDLLRLKYLLDILVLCFAENLSQSHVALAAVPRCFHLTVTRK
jgi:hypothetical protein